jgi:hypothetical protein
MKPDRSHSVRRTPLSTFLLFAAAICGAGSASAQGTTAAPAAQPPAANPADVTTIDSIVPVLYATISGPVGAPRQWDRMRSLFHPDARLMPTGCDGVGNCRALIMTVPGYIERADTLLRRTGFREVEIARRTVRYGNIAHVFSTYESYQLDETEPFNRGINSIQLLWDGRRWWIMGVLWDSERSGGPIPAEYEAGIE